MRNYRRKGIRADPDRRMTVVVRLRAEGMSLRQIAHAIGIATKSTVARDLARWDREHPNVTPLVSHNAVPNCPPRGEMGQPDGTANVTQLRRLS